MLFLLTTIADFTLFVPSVMAATVKTEEEFYTAIENGTNADIKSECSFIF